MPGKTPCIICDIDGTLCEAVVRLLEAYSNVKVIFLTGRPEFMHDLTMKHIEQIFGYEDELIMKSSLDLRRHWKYKREIVRNLKEKYDILFAIDDQNSIAKMYQSEKINCLRVMFHENGSIYKPN